MKKKLVLIGGGSGLSAMMKGLKHLHDVEMSCIITVADDGGSTGRLREVYHIPAMGDIRHVISAMAQSDNALLERLMDYRFAGDRDIGGHQLGNLIFLALVDLTGSFVGAIEALSHVFKINGKIIPSTLDNVYLYAWMKDGTLVRGEASIPEADNAIDQVFYQQQITPYSKAIEAIEQADLIIYGLGSLYTSILPNLIIDGIQQAIQANPCKKIYVCNKMTQPGETDGYSLEDHVRAIEKHTFEGAIDLVLADNSLVPQDSLDKYALENSYPVSIREKEHGYEIIEAPLITIDHNGYIRHDPKRVAQWIDYFCRELI